MEVLTKPLIKPQEMQRTTMQQLLLQWRLCEVISAIFSIIGWVVATIDYEVRYASDRDHGNCAQKEENNVLRWLDVCLTIISLLFLLLRHTAKRQWNFEKLRQKSVTEKSVLSPQHSLFHFTTRLLAECVILCIFPYPDVEGNIYVDQRSRKSAISIEFIKTDACYTVSEILYVLMLLRFFFILRAAINMSKFMDGHSKQICQKYRVKANMRFALRALVKASPFWMMVIFVLPTALLASVAIRVFERPYMDINGQDFGDYRNCIWFTYVTMTTIGYGDYVTATELGRFVAIIIGVWGVFVFSMMIYIIDNTFQMSKQQNKSFFKIKQTREAAALIEAFFVFIIVRKEHPLLSREASDAYERVVQRGISFRKRVLRPLQLKKQKQAAKVSMLGKLKELEGMLLHVENKSGDLDKLEQDLQDMVSMLKALSLYQYGYILE